MQGVNNETAALGNSHPGLRGCQSEGDAYAEEKNIIRFVTIILRDIEDVNQSIDCTAAYVHTAYTLLLYVGIRRKMSTEHKASLRWSFSSGVGYLDLQRPIPRLLSIYL